MFGFVLHSCRGNNVDGVCALWHDGIYPHTLVIYKDRAE